MSRAEKIVYDEDIDDNFDDYIRDDNLQEYDFRCRLYKYADGVKEYSRLVIHYPSLSAHYPGFQRALEDTQTHIKNFLVSRFDYPIPVEIESRDSYENIIKARVSQSMGNELVPIITDEPYIGLRADHYERFKDRLEDFLAWTKFNWGVFKPKYIVSYDVRDDLLPLWSERDSHDWDYVSTEFYRLGLFHYVNIPLPRNKLDQNIFDLLRARQAWVEDKNNNVVDITGFDEGLSEIIREEIRQAPDSENKIIVLPLTGMTKLLFEVYGNEIITRDANVDYYKPLLFEGREIVLETEEYYDFMLWVMSTRTNLIRVMLEHRDFFNDKLETKSLEWVLKYTFATDYSLGLSERDRFLLESFLCLMDSGFSNISWCEVRWFAGDNRFNYNLIVDSFNHDFRDRFKALDCRVGRFKN